MGHKTDILYVLKNLNLSALHDVRKKIKPYKKYGFKQSVAMSYFYKSYAKITSVQKKLLGTSVALKLWKNIYHFILS